MDLLHKEPLSDKKERLSTSAQMLSQWSVHIGDLYDLAKQGTVTAAPDNLPTVAKEWTKWQSYSRNYSILLPECTLFDVPSYK